MWLKIILFILSHTGNNSSNCCGFATFSQAIDRSQCWVDNRNIGFQSIFGSRRWLTEVEADQTSQAPSLKQHRPSPFDHRPVSGCGLDLKRCQFRVSAPSTTAAVYNKTKKWVVPENYDEYIEESTKHFLREDYQMVRDSAGRMWQCTDMSEFVLQCEGAPEEETTTQPVISSTYHFKPKLGKAFVNAVSTSSETCSFVVDGRRVLHCYCPATFFRSDTETTIDDPDVLADFTELLGTDHGIAIYGRGWSAKVEKIVFASLIASCILLQLSIAVIYVAGVRKPFRAPKIRRGPQPMRSL